MTEAEVFPYLAGWTVLSLRPASQQAAVARAIAARGGNSLALPGIALEAMPGARPALQAALACRRVIFTSPAAVEFADALLPLSSARIDVALAVGSGTARALAARGVVAVQPPSDAMRSEGVLALRELAEGDDAVGLVTAPGGRDVIAPALRARGVPVSVAAVYRRVAPAWNAEAIDALVASRPPRAVLLTSGEALEHVLAALPAAARTPLLASVAVASSERLAQAARAAGFEHTLVAASPVTDALLDALAAHAKAGAIR